MTEEALWEREAGLLLTALGLSPRSRGSRNLRCALGLAAGEPELLLGGMGRLWEQVGACRGCTPERAERSVRETLALLWRQGDRRLRRWFPRIYGENGPGAAAFLRVLCREMAASRAAGAGISGEKRRKSTRF